MCLNPTRIKNPSRRGVHNATKMFLTVPCGKCDDCRSSMQLDWFVRCFHEIEAYKQSGGVSIFTTLTYRPSCRPAVKLDTFGKTDVADITHVRKSFTGRKVFGFSKDDKNRFLDSLRHRLNIPKLRYLWCCEYGMSKNHEHAPHYHVILHIPYTFFLGKDYDDALKEIRIAVNELWHYGIVRWSKPKQVPCGPLSIDRYNFSGRGSELVTYDKKHHHEPVNNSLCSFTERNLIRYMVVNSDFAARYVGKYCVKDLGFFENPLIEDFLNDEPDYIKNESDLELQEVYRNNLRKEKLNWLKPILPRHWQSHGYGESLYEKIKNEFSSGIDVSHYFVDGVKMDCLSDKIEGKQKTYKLPRYVVNRLCYRRLDNNQGVTILNDFGKEMKQKLFSHNVHYAKNDYLRFWTTPELHNKLSGVDLANLFPFLPNPSISGLQEYVRDLDINPDLFVLWRKVFDGLYLLQSSEHLLRRFDPDNTLEEWYNFAFDIYKMQIDPSGDILDDSFFRVHREKYRQSYNVSSFPLFRNFEEVSLIMNLINAEYHKSSQQSYYKKSLRLRNTKNLLLYGF